MSMDLALALHRIGKPRILVIGDYIEDREEHCTSHRFAQEAAHCPVWKFDHQNMQAGGAGAVNKMVTALGADTVFIAAPLSYSATKTRYFVNGVQQLRIDTDARPLSAEQSNRIAAHVADEVQRADCVLIADYGKGVLNQSVLRAAIDWAKTRGIPCIVDPANGASCYRYKSASCLKLNHHEAIAMGDISTREHFPIIIETRGADGIILRARNCDDRTFVGRPRHIVDATGCGDVVLASVGVAFAGHLRWSDACKIANAAAGLKVGRRGAVPVPRAEVVLDLLDGEKCIPAELLPTIRRMTNPDKLIFTNGVFRLPHAGHAWLMRWAKQQGNTLVVGINDDASAARQCPGEYVMPLAERMAMLAAMETVDYVVPFGEDTPDALLAELKADILVKGGEYSGQRVPGADLVREMRFAPESPYPSHATTIITEIGAQR